MSGISRRAVVGGMAGTAALTAMTGTAVATTGGPDGETGDGGTRHDGAEALRPVRLTTEHLADPLGIDVAHLRFGWHLEAGGRNRAQSAYQIQVATSPNRLWRNRPDVWDSGRVESSEQTARAYQGPALRSRTRYFWTVRVWETNRRGGQTSDVAWFETALLDTSEWTAEWIGSGIELPETTRTLGPSAQVAGDSLRPGHSLGQTFESARPVTGVVVLLAVAAEIPASCVLTLRRDDPAGAVLGRREFTGLAADKYGNASIRLDLEEPGEPGGFYVELSEPDGDVRWMSTTYAPGQDDAYEEGSAYADGGERPDMDRWLYALAPPPPANPLLRREFDLAGPVVSARLYICGLGHAVAWVNGQRVGDAEMSPLTTNYDIRALYTTHDVTEQLRPGPNALGIALGRGFFSTRAPHSDGSELASWLAEPQLKAQLEVVLAGGRRVVIGTDTDWQLADGPTTYEGLYAGESYDARRAAALSGWSEPGHHGGGWRRAAIVPAPRGRLEAYAGLPVRAGEPVEPVHVGSPADGVLLYDFGVVRSGWVRLSGRLPEGTTVRMLYSEKLAESGRIEPGTPGGFDNPAVDGRYQVDEFTAAGTAGETWQASFTCKSFRYVEVTWTTADGREPRAGKRGLPDLELVAVPVQSDLSSTMELELGDPALQWIAETVRQTNLNGVHGHPDISALGKLGWLSATERASWPLLYMFDMTSPFAKWLEDIRLSQADSGEIPIIAPVGGVLAGFPLSPTTTALYPSLVRRYWLVYGDATVPARHFDAVRRYLDWVLGQIGEDLPDDVFGDWYPPRPVQGPRPPEGGRLVATAYVIRNLRDATALADLLGHAEQAARWRAEEAALIRRFNDAFLDTEAGAYTTGVDGVGYRQTSNAVPLAFGLVPDAHVDAVASGLAADVEARDRHLNTGALGTGALPFALTDHGRPDLAHAVLAKRDYPSYGYLRGLGATALWESWEADSRAHNDTTLSEPLRWLVERVLGVEVLRPGWARFRVAPRAFGSLPDARMVLDTVRGEVAVAWRRKGGGVELTLRVPVNAVAEVTMPDGTEHELGSGAYTLTSSL